MKMTELGFRARSASYANLHWKTIQNLLRFVQRGRILVRCGSAFALSLPSLGVSSLDLGRLFTQAALFSWVVLSFRKWSEGPDVRHPSDAPIGPSGNDGRNCYRFRLR